MGNDRMTICRKIKLFPVGDKDEINRVYDFIRNGQYAQYQACNLLMGQLMSEYYRYNRDIKNEEFKARQKEIMTNSNIILKDIDFTIDSGEVVGLIAPSGFGKTTLAKILQLV